MADSPSILPPVRRWIPHVVLTALLGACVLWYADANSTISGKEADIENVIGQGDPDGIVPALEKELRAMENARIMAGIVLTFLGGGLVGMIVVLHVVPMLAEKATHAVYDSGEMVERDVMHDARSLVAQGKYEEAVLAFREAAEKDPSNRLPWVEAYRIQSEQLHQPFAAAETLRTAVEAHPWQADDAAYFLFRLSELHDGPLEDRDGAVAMLQQVVALMPQTRHSANATQRLREWGVEAAPPTDPGPQRPQPFAREEAEI